MISRADPATAGGGGQTRSSTRWREALSRGPGGLSARVASAAVEGDGVEQGTREERAERHRLADHDDGGRLEPRGTGGDVAERPHHGLLRVSGAAVRSEERREGKECRS